MLVVTKPTSDTIDTSSLRYEPMAEPFADVEKMSNGKIIVDMAYFKAGRKGAINNAYLRLDVVNRLLRVAESLPSDYRLKIYDAWRPYQVQEDLFYEYRSSLAARPENKGKSEAELTEMAKKYVSFPDKTKEFAYVHSSGGAVDLTLTDKWGIELDMGCGFDDFSPISATFALEESENPTAYKNRRILYNAMTAAGFTNYPSEWWHYDYGDIFWGALTGNAVKYTSVYSLSQVVSSNSESTITEKYDIFISYRRGSGEVMARLIYELLKKRNYSVFFDHQSLSAGKYDEKILKIIKECTDFIVVLSDNCFKVEGESGKYYMKEIRCALDSGRSILPLMMEDFLMPSDKVISTYTDPETVSEILEHHGKNIKVDGIDGILDEICSNKNLLRSTPRLTAAEVVKKCDDFVDLINDKTCADMLSEDTKLSVVRSAIDALSDEYSAPILKGTLSRLSNGVFNVRKEFKYDISIDKNFNFKFIGIPSDKYFRLSETLKYKKVFRIGKPNTGEDFWISFVTGLDELDDELRNENFFFSENLMLDRDDMIKLTQLDEASKLDFYNLVMGIRIAINNNSLSPAEIIIDNSGIFARYEMPDVSGDTLDTAIKFRIPQKYDNSFFFACISEPTYSPTICVTYDEFDFNVEMIPFLTRSLTAKDTRVIDGECELSVKNEWIMPVSGAIFLINKKM